MGKHQRRAVLMAFTKDEFDRVTKSMGRETFWAIAGALAVEGAFTVWLDSTIGLQIFQATIAPVMIFGLGVFGYKKFAGAISVRK